MVINTHEGNDVVVLTYWGWMPEETLKGSNYKGEIKDGGAEVCCMVGAGHVLLKLEPNPFLTRKRPFVKDCFEEIPHEFYGLGIPEISDGAQKALDTVVRQRIDNKAVGINNIFAVDARRLMPDQDLTVHPNKVFLTDGRPSDIFHQFTVQDMTSSTYRDSAEYERWIQEGAGISKTLGGMPMQKEASATESKLVYGQASQRIKMVVQNLEENSLKSVMKWYYQIIMQFLNIPEFLRVTDAPEQIKPALVEGLLSVSPQNIAGDYDFVPMGTYHIGLQDNLGKHMQWLQITANPMDVQMTNRAFHLQQAYKAIFGLRDLDKAFVPKPPPQLPQGGQASPPKEVQPAPQGMVPGG
ncbi:MAG: portal protein [Candidatus Thorarchaeota archaeon]